MEKPSASQRQFGTARCMALGFAYFALLIGGLYKARLLAELLIRPEPQQIQTMEVPTV